MEYFKKIRISAIDFYFILWAPFILVQSVVVLPVKGATLGYIFALLSPVIVILYGATKNRNRYIMTLLVCLFFYCLITLLSQFGNIILEITHNNLTLIDYTDPRLYFRKTLVTQSIYLFAGLVTFLFIRFFYKITWDKHLFIGAGFLAIYGLYEILYFLIFDETGDFLSNRIVGSGELARLDSLFQTINIGEMSIMRLKSLTGEPSMYCFTTLPFCIYAFHTKRYKTAYLLFATLLLSTSATAFLGIMLYFLSFSVIRYINKAWMYRIMFLVIGIMVITFIFKDVTAALYETQILAKIKLMNISGEERFAYFLRHITYYSQLNVWGQLVGIGFGTVRSTDLFSTLLVNTGIVGFFIFTIVFFYPVLKLKNNHRNHGIKIALIVIYTVTMISVPEFSYLSVWIFLGIAYHQLDCERVMSDYTGYWHPSFFAKHKNGSILRSA